jgi:hypothetical protein
MLTLARQLDPIDHRAEVLRVAIGPGSPTTAELNATSEHRPPSGRGRRRATSGHQTLVVQNRSPPRLAPLLALANGLWMPHIVTATEELKEEHHEHWPGPTARSSSAARNATLWARSQTGGIRKQVPSAFLCLSNPGNFHRSRAREIKTTRGEKRKCRATICKTKIFFFMVLFKLVIR